MEFLSNLAQFMCHGLMAMINKHVTFNSLQNTLSVWMGGQPCIIFECRGVTEFIKATSKLRKKCAQSSRWEVNEAGYVLFCL